jgi:hypothetical protein
LDAWEGTPVAAKAQPNRQRFELLPDDGDQRAAVDALICLGAARLEVGNDGTVVLTDPDGNEFCVRPTGRHPAGSAPRRAAHARRREAADRQQAGGRAHPHRSAPTPNTRLFDSET